MLWGALGRHEVRHPVFPAKSIVGEAAILLQSWHKQPLTELGVWTPGSLPGVLFYLAGKVLASGHVHSLAGEVLIGAVLVCGFGVGVAASVVRQVFAVSLYRVATTSGQT